MGMVFPINAQESEQDLDEILDEILAYDSLLLDEFNSDSASIFSLIDSLLETDFRFSMLALRSGYTSEILNAGRDFGVEQYGLMGGFSYYHRSGLFGDLTAYWNSDVEPKINPIATTLGYMGSAGKWLTYFFSYDHYFYISENHEDSIEDIYSPISNALNGSAYANIKFITTGVDYSFLFGDETAHRIRGTLYARINIKKVPLFDRISIYPTASILAGNQNIYYITTNYQLINSITESIKKYGRKKASQFYQQYEDLIYEQVFEEEVDNVFGILNYGLSLPVYMYIKNFSLSLAYYHNFPQALPGEQITYDPNGYFSISLIYNIPFIKK